jgi:CRP-like cAMP-binding protein
LINFQVVNFTDGQYIFKIGDQATDLYFLEQGEVELLNESKQVFGVIPQGQSFGETAILKGGIRGASIRAKGDVVCKKIQNDDAAELLCSYSPLLVIIMEGLLLQQVMNNAIKYA